MTIYIVKFKEDHQNEVPPIVSHYATSSYVKAQAKVVEIGKMPHYEVIRDVTGDQIQKWKPKNQADVINLINNLYNTEEL